MFIVFNPLEEAGVFMSIMRILQIKYIILLLLALVGGGAAYSISKIEPRIIAPERLAIEKGVSAEEQNAAESENENNNLTLASLQSAQPTVKQLAVEAEAETRAAVSEPLGAGGGSNAASIAKAEEISVSLIISGIKFDTAASAGSSVYDLMVKLREEKKIDFKGKDYSGLGFFVEEIDGVKNNQAGNNWFYYVNGQQAPVGVSSYKIKNNDVVEWKYEK
jgi:hypothetical protein